MRKLKILFIIIGISVSVNANAQLVEHYENPQRFQFSQFDDHSNFIPLMIHNGGYYDTNILFARRYSIGSSRVIYGVAIPAMGHDVGPIVLSSGTIEQKLGHLINYLDTSGCSVVVGNLSQTPNHEYDIVARTNIRLGKTALIGNYFKMPDSDSARFQSLQYSIYFPVIEVYFDQPQLVSSNFIAGCPLAPHQVYSDGGYIDIFCNVLCIYNVQSTEQASYINIVDNSYITTHSYFYENLQNTWGGPFPIVTPPPCMPPVFIKVDEQHRKSVTISWCAQYGTAYSEVEYGPQGFTEGTGTTVGPIVPDSNFNGHLAIDSLEMNADYTVRVRSYCEGTGGYSDWAEMDFHTESFYIVSTSANSDTCGEVRGAGTYPADTTIKLYAYPKPNKHFLNWSDGSNQNPRVVTVTCDTSFHAIFQCDDPDTGGGTESIEVSGHGQMLLTISPNPTNGITSIHCDVPILTWTLYDTKGRALKTESPATEDAAADLLGLPPAVYILSVKTESGYATRKIIVK